MDRDVLMQQMTDRFQELYNRALDALDLAPDGQWEQHWQNRKTA
jgi:hypothetical protein